MAEVVWAIRYEMARTIDDVLSRRVRLLFLDARAAIAVSEKYHNCLQKNLDMMMFGQKTKQPNLKNLQTISFTRISNKIINKPIN
jgi:glycerol-3-phosphate dehydrogenase